MPRAASSSRRCEGQLLLLTSPTTAAASGGLAMDTSAAIAEARHASPGDAVEDTTVGPATRAEEEEVLGEQSALEADEALALSRALVAELQVRVFCDVLVSSLSLGVCAVLVDTKPVELTVFAPSPLFRRKSWPPPVTCSAMRSHTQGRVRSTGGRRGRSRSSRCGVVLLVTCHAGRSAWASW